MIFKFAKVRKHYDIKKYLFATVIALCFLYGFYQLVADRGLFTLYKIHQELEHQKQENELLKKRQDYLEIRVEKLEENSENFDYDYLEELIRSKLGVIKPNEEVIYVEE